MEILTTLSFGKTKDIDMIRWEKLKRYYQEISPKGRKESQTDEGKKNSQITD